MDIITDYIIKDRHGRLTFTEEFAKNISFESMTPLEAYASAFDNETLYKELRGLYLIRQANVCISRPNEEARYKKLDLYYADLVGGDSYVKEDTRFADKRYRDHHNFFVGIMPSIS